MRVSWMAAVCACARARDKAAPSALASCGTACADSAERLGA